MTAIPPTREHDAKLCGCMNNEPCVCPCVKCCAFQKSRDHLTRMLVIEDRLRRAGIDPEDFAALIHLKHKRQMSEEIERIVQEKLTAALEDMTLSARVTWSNLK